MATLSILFALLGAFSQALTSVLQRLANVTGSDQKRSGWQTTKFLIRQPIWLLGMVCMGGTFIFTALALYFGTLATVQPILVTELIFTLALRALWLHDGSPPGPGGRPLSCAPGCSVSSWSPIPEEGHGRPTAAAWAVAIGSRGLVVVVLVVLSRWGSPPAGRPARRGGRPGMGRRRRLRQGSHRGAGP